MRTNITKYAVISLIISINGFTVLCIMICFRVNKIQDNCVIVCFAHWLSKTVPSYLENQ